MKNKLIIQNRSAGFFSDFNMVTSCLTLLHEGGEENFKVLWNNIYYCNNDTNLFDKFFYPSKNFDSYDEVIDICTISGSFLGHTNPQSTWDRMYNALTYYNYFDNIIYKQCKDECFKGSSTLGVHIRGTDHHRHGELLNLDSYIYYINTKLLNHRYDNIFIATDENRIVKSLIDVYGSMIKINDNITRSNTTNAIHYSNFENKEKLATDVMKDCISLSLCDEIILTSSNIAGYVLSINPHIQHTFIDSHIKYH